MTRSEPSRRDLLKTAGATAAVTAALPNVVTARKSSRGATGTLRVGLVGCGGRGTGAAVQALRADADVQLVALGDAFADHLDSSLASLSEIEDIQAKIVVDDAHKFVGWDAYKGVIEASDVVLLATSPHFRPLHVAAAVEAGKHLFVEKPVATDAVGLRWIRESCREAASKGLSVVSGLCYRYENAKRATIARIHEGAIGDIVSMQATYNAGPLWLRQPDPNGEPWTEMERQMRNWLYYTWLSGDHIAEQHIHSLDKLAWAMGSYPVSCVSSGGRIQRVGDDYGDVYDHFNTVYEWENGVRGFSSCRQWGNAATNVSDYIFGSRGVAEMQRHKIEAGPWSWRHRSDEPDDMYQNEHDALFAAIRKGEPIDNGEYMCDSTLMAIMGRMSAYTGKVVTREEAENSTLDLRPASYAWGDAPAVVVKRPGETEFV